MLETRLETRKTPISTRTRRSSISARPNVRPFAERAMSVPRPVSQGQTAAREQAAAEPIRRALPSARQSRLSRSEMRLMGLAMTCTAVVCALLLLYLAAYAHVTQLGIEQSQARGQLRQNQNRNEMLQAERNSLESPQRIVAAAAAQGMMPRGATPINYVAARPAHREAGQNGVEIASDWDQGSNVGTTEDSRAAASFHH